MSGGKGVLKCNLSSSSLIFSFFCLFHTSITFRSTSKSCLMTAALVNRTFYHYWGLYQTFITYTHMSINSVLLFAHSHITSWYFQLFQSALCLKDSWPYAPTAMSLVRCTSTEYQPRHCVTVKSCSARYLLVTVTPKANPITVPLKRQYQHKIVKSFTVFAIRRTSCGRRCATCSQFF
jgi:hypothetical protein